MGRFHYSRRLLGHACLAASLFVGVGAQLLLKFAMTLVNTHPNLWSPYLWVLCGLGTYAVGTGFWILCLTFLNLSYAYSFTGLNYVLILGASWFLFNEVVSLQHIAGVGMICTGIVLIPAGLRRRS